MNTDIFKKIEESQYKKRPDVKVGDTAKLSVRIKEGNKERVQVFEGLVIALKGSGLGRTITVRKMSYGVSVERIVPLHSPTLDKIEVVQRGKVRKSKLYYVREKIGKRALKVSNLKDLYLTDEAEVAEEPEKAESKSETEQATAA
ncbi:MAG: 50S ribosomal protein L19 [candidate division WS6 bacterium GW2011_GWF2_39_15]|uniref:Large ribosomal subunit protein bL19 n=1 Tax=candidate division WS6 bacterium GW2011_GWF2_39_15 TaxID=1619100 RepID=A0A0G0MSC6_9BACT|nr:MAG: 50S ribosomal protein L19 [candidate division WS6 bacterium GW2011_GWF2_39_15]